MSTTIDDLIAMDEDERARECSVCGAWGPVRIQNHQRMCEACCHDCATTWTRLCDINVRLSQSAADTNIKEVMYFRDGDRISITIV